MDNTIIVALIGFLGAILVPIITFILNKIQTNEIKRSFSKNSEDIIEQLEHIREYPNFPAIVNDITGEINKYIENCNEEEKSATIELKLIAVAMTYSWPDFIDLTIDKFLKSKKPEHENLNITLKILYVDHQYLEKYIDAKQQVYDPKGRVSTSMQRDTDIIAFYNKHKQKFLGQNNFEAKTIRDLPQWHGWLVKTDKDRLYLGETRWELSNNGPILRVGENEYRRFEEGSPQSNNQIDWYKGWFDYYWDSKPLSRDVLEGIK